MDTLEKKVDRVTGKPEASTSDPAAHPPLVVNRIRQALVTSRVTLGAQSTGLDPYDSRRAKTPGAVWSDRVRR
jgi:hypothetical protein